MKDVETIIFEFFMAGGLTASILYVAFGQITVRKLRKKPATKAKLGLELASGWDILNVAGSLSTPKWLRKKFSNSPLSFLHADYQVLYENTTPFDRILARIFSIIFYVSGTIGILLVSLDALGILD